MLLLRGYLNEVPGHSQHRDASVLDLHVPEAVEPGKNGQIKVKIQEIANVATYYLYNGPFPKSHTG